MPRCLLTPFRLTSPFGIRSAFCRLRTCSRSFGPIANTCNSTTSTSPKRIEVAPDYLKLDIPQTWISEWELELLAKEIILNGSAVASKGRTLKQWKTLSEYVNALKKLENDIYGALGSPKDVLVELIRVAHQQFIWQGNPPHSDSIIRYFKIFNQPAIDKIAWSGSG